MAFSTPSPQVPSTLLSSSSSTSSSIQGTPYDDSQLFNAYEIAMQEVLTSFRVMQKKDNPQDLEAAKRFLFSPQRFVDPSPGPNTAEDFKHHLIAQGDMFVKDVNINKNQNLLIKRALTYMGDYCAKRGTSAPLHIAWDKVKEAGFIPRESSLSAYLYILSSLPLGNIEANDDAKTITTYNPDDVAGEVACYHDMIYKPTENTVSIRIKSLVEVGKAEEAENLLWNLESVASSTPLQEQGKKKKKVNDNGTLRLRTCVPVLQSYCQDGDMSRGLQLYQKMRQVPSVHFEAETYVLILSSLARRGYFRKDSEPIHGAGEFGYESRCGAPLFDAIATEMADDVLEISSDSAKDMRNAFVDGFASSESAKNLYIVPYDCDLSSLSDLVPEEELVANRITIDSNSTVCLRTNATLRLILLEECQRKQVHDTLIEMADTQFDAYETKLQKKGNKPSKISTEDNYAGKHLEGFADWLNDREGEPFTCIIDGANVAYYGIGCINYHQIKLMVKSLEKMGEKPLVIMPQKYAQKKFHLRQGYVQELPESQMAILQEMEDTGMLYKVPHRCLDDYYWMLSSVSNQTLSRNGATLDVSLHNEDGRFPGTRPILLTNDQMRDHKLELLEPRLFRRWVSSHIVNYHFPPFVNDAWEEREVTFAPADFTSREIQGNPSNSNGDNDNGAMAWHFPVRDWDKNDRFCVRIPTI